MLHYSSNPANSTIPELWNHLHHRQQSHISCNSLLELRQSIFKSPLKQPPYSLPHPLTTKETVPIRYSLHRPPSPVQAHRSHYYAQPKRETKYVINRSSETGKNGDNKPTPSRARAQHTKETNPGEDCKPEAEPSAQDRKHEPGLPPPPPQGGRAGNEHVRCLKSLNCFAAVNQQLVDQFRE